MLSNLVRERFRDWVLDPAFCCVGAKSAVQRSRYELTVYPEVASPSTTTMLARDLAAFVNRQDPADTGFSSYVASFTSPEIEDELSFEQLLWQQLQRLHEADCSAWDSSVSSDPADDRFTFSFSGRAFFVVGLHPSSSRVARRFPWPTLVFNARFQFEHLRRRGRYRRMQEIIRARDRAMQGDVNPMLSDFGTWSEARQYSGRTVPDTWVCPFRGRNGEPER